MAFEYTYIDARSGEKRISFLLISRCVFTQVNNVNVFFFLIERESKICRELKEKSCLNLNNFNDKYIHDRLIYN